MIKVYAILFPVIGENVTSTLFNFLFIVNIHIFQCFKMKPHQRNIFLEEMSNDNYYEQCAHRNTI